MRTLKKHYKMFQQECKRSLKKYSLKSWTPYFEHGMHESAPDALSAMYVNKEEHAVFLYFNTEWNVDVTEGAIRECARHEVFELLLNSLGEMASAKFNDETVNGETHKIINRLEGAV